MCQLFGLPRAFSVTIETNQENYILYIYYFFSPLPFARKKLLEFLQINIFK